MRVLCCCVRFSYLVLSREIGWEERLRNDILCRVEHRTFNSISQCFGPD